MAEMRFFAPVSHWLGLPAGVVGWISRSVQECETPQRVRGHFNSIEQLTPGRFSRRVKMTVTFSTRGVQLHAIPCSGDFLDINENKQRARDRLALCFR